MIEHIKTRKRQRSTKV